MKAPADKTMRRELRLDIEAIRTDSLQRFGVVLMLVSIIPWGAFLEDTDQPWPLVVFASLTLAGLAIYFLRQRLPNVAQGLLLLGPTLSLVLALRLLAHPAAPYYTVLIVIAGFALSPLHGIAAAVLETGVLLALRPGGVVPIWAIVLIWLVMATAWIASRGLDTALHWAWSSQQRMAALMADLRTHQERLNRTLIALTEATDRLARTNRELAIARQQADEARALKEQFVANVSHELRTPLNLIVGFAEMMYASPENYPGVGWTPELVSDIGEIYRASRHLQSLVNDVLDLARIDAARLPMFRELLNPRPVIAEAVDTIAPLLAQRGLSYSVQWPEDLPQIYMDRTRIRQVLLNLLNNAVRFTDKGSITIRVEKTAEAVVVSVSDTGIGIPADRLEHIFEKFTQVHSGPRRREGAGLGLALSREFVRLHGGEMWATSQLGVGSTFYFSLPLPGVLPKTATLQPLPPRKKLDFRDAPLVIVDPDPSIADMLSRYLDNRPTLAARDVDEAEALIESHHPLAVVVNLPPDAPRQNWLGPIGRLSARYSVPVLRCSIPSLSWLQQSAGLDDCLSKPVSREMLRSVLARYCPGPGKVLVVDDDQGFVNLISRMLGTMEVTREVFVAYGGAEALRLAHTARPDVILLDLLMPEMDGFAVVEAIHRDPQLRKTWIVALTATSYAEEALRRRGGHLTLSQSQGLSTGTLMRLLNAALEVVQPDYLAEEKAPSMA